MVAGIALYRPGPMQSIPKYIANKKDPSKIKYVTPELASVLDVTYGCLIYQEQVMQIVRDLAGYSYGRSDLVRRAMSKKKQDVMEEEHKWFVHGKENEDGTVDVPGCVRNGISEQAADTIFDEMRSFAEYAFNKSHAAAYAVVAFQTGYLKKYYPLEFMAALMTSVMGKPEDVSKYINYCRQVGIQVLPPSIISSQKKFAVEGDKIRFGLLALKGVGEGAIDEVIRARELNGPPKDIFSFVESVDLSLVNKKAVESFIKSGAFDCLNPNRAMHLAIYETLMESTQKNNRKNLDGQISLFQLEEEIMNTGDVNISLPDIENFSEDVLLSLEKEVTGVYITGHPLNTYSKRIREIASLELGALSAGESGDGDDETEIVESDGPVAMNGQILKDNDKVIVVGMIMGRRKLVTKNSKIMEFIQLEDMTGTGEIIVFPNTYEKYGQELREDRVLVIGGHLNFKEGEQPKIIADSIIDIDYYEHQRNVDEEAQRDLKKNPGQYDDAVKLRIPPKGSGVGTASEMEEEEVMDRILALIDDFSGDECVLVYKRDGSIQMRSGAMGTGVRPSLRFADQAAELLGNANVKIKKIARTML